MPKENVLFVLTSHDDLGGVRKTGFHVNEAAGMWAVFKDAGCEVSLASIQGGEPPQDRRRDSDVAREFLGDRRIRSQLRNTPSVTDVDPHSYAAVMYVGGHGAMWDFPDNRDVQRIGRSMFEDGRVVSAICHGPAALVNISLSDGSLLVAGTSLTCFTDEEEVAVDLADVVPFLLAETLTKRGASVVSAENFSANSVIHGRLVTGQNPTSAAATASRVVRVIRAD